MTNTPTTENRLREENLVVGQLWVHPDTQLEYEDFHAWLAGKDPLPYWRNARIKELQRLLQDKSVAGNLPASRPGETCAQYISRIAARIVRDYDRHGSPTVAARTDEHGLSLADA